MNFSTRLEFTDNRCAEHSLWNPTTCRWKFTDCEDTSERLTTIVPQVETIKKHNYLSFCISISLLLGCAFLISVYHLMTRHNSTTQYKRTVANEDNDTTKKNTNITEIQNINIIPKNDDKSNGVILLYVKSSSFFLKFMADFGNILKRCCHCDVYDWYGVNELEATELGPSNWVNKLRERGCRIVWVDTPFSRSLVLSHAEENYQKKLLLCGDFRDEAFPGILNMEKHCINDPTSLYENHFIIRFDALPVHDDADDPFADISPYARYMMPRHFNQLCLDLSRQVSVMENNTFEVIDTTTEINEELQQLVNTLKNSSVGYEQST
ncbi:uncharacterized protein LOC107274447 [Cephus cinctus]|uniref:Uncharacterized protein LOC107274447 n=1 Tax=Cephus cinctus TaxID=211228 RepID=A0AAJ7FUK4_CEPCN|nr:uncharacterized protein LOC107274447 [Cephus cinctus]